MARPTTKPGKLSDLARHVVLPTGIATTGWPAVRDKCRELFGDEFDEWQDGAGRAMLAKREDGIYAATVGGIVLSIPRQVAKTFLVGRIVVALCLLFPGMTILWTAHRTRTATRTFQSLQRLAKRKKVSAHVRHIRTANGEQEIAFRNGSVILFGAREQGFGRGFDEVDVEVFDEAQILTEKALEDMVAATNQSRHEHGALLFFMGTPPRPSDPGEAFLFKRTKALSGKSEDMVYIEFSADEDAGLDDHKQWARANPSYPHRTPLESMLRLRENLPSDDSWRREALGIWDCADETPSIFGKGKWEACASTLGLPEVPAAIGVAVSVDRMWASIAAASLVEIPGDPNDPESEPVDRPFVAAVDRREEVDWLVARVAEIQAKHPECMVVVDEKGPTKDLIEDMEDADVAVEAISLDEYAEACSDIFDKVRAGDLLHPSSSELNDAVSGAAWRTVGDRQVWGRRKSARDVSMLEAATLALFGAEKVGAAFNIH